MIYEFLAAIHGYSATPRYELRVITSRKYRLRDGSLRNTILCGVYDDIDRLLLDADHFSGLRFKPDDNNPLPPMVTGVYFGINPPGERVPITNRLEQRTTVKNSDILRRTDLAIDIDSVREKNTSADETQKQAAVEMCNCIIPYLAKHGMEEIWVVDSGNGIHLHLGIDLQECPETADLVRRFMLVLSRNFVSPFAKVDPVVFNASRIFRLPGTFACKGLNTPATPYRRAHIVREPKESKQ